MDPRAFGFLEWGGFIALCVAIVMMTWRHEGRKFRRGKRLLDAVRAGARRAGWEFEEFHAVGSYRLRGRSPGGVPWQLDFTLMLNSTGEPSKIVWCAPSLAASPTAFRLTTPAAARRAHEGPMRLTMELAGDLGMRMGTEPIEDMVGLAAPQNWIEPEHPRLRGKVVFLCRDPRRGREIFDAQVEKLLAELPSGLIVSYDFSLSRHDAGLQVRVLRQVGAPALAERLVRLGEALADRVARMTG